VFTPIGHILPSAVTFLQGEKMQSKRGKKASSQKKSKKENLQRLYSEMCKLSNDAVDREVMKRFKVIIDTCEEDITKKSFLAIIKDHRAVDPTDYNEILQPYIKHYVFLAKREKRKIAK
jgi:hypothetical protein